MKKKQDRGITLIALVITIIILIILAGVSISVVIGENGIIARGIEAKKLQKIAELTEKLELEKISVAMDHMGEVKLDNYLTHIVEQGIVREDNIERIEEGQAHVTLEDKYVFLVEEIGSGDIKITYTGEEGNLSPRITEIKMSSTSNSITVEVEGIRIEEAEYRYYIKTEEGGEYGEVVGNNTTGTYTYEGLEQNQIYYVKVEVITANGTSSKESNKTTGTIVGLTEKNTTIRSTPEGWTNGVVKTTIETSVEGYTLEYSKDLETWTNYTQEIESSENGTIYARLTDGKNIGEYIEIPITNIDTTMPEEANIELSGAGTVESNPVLKATIAHTDSESGVEIGNSKWVYNTTGEAIGTEEASYTGGSFTNNGEELSLPMSTEGTYYLHVLSIDKGGNARESISKPITMIANKHQHSGSSSSGGGCYTKGVYHTHTDSCYGSTTYGIWRYKGTHVDGNGDTRYDTYCDLCGAYEQPYANTLDGSIHCSKKNLTCGKSTTTPISYQLGCNKTENTIVSYTISY